jgi:hypothetical protein
MRPRDGVSAASLESVSTSSQVHPPSFERITEVPFVRKRRFGSIGSAAKS